MNFAEATALADASTTQACAQFAASVLPVLPLEGLAVVLLDSEKETRRVVFSMDSGNAAGIPWDRHDVPPMCIPLRGREGELGAVLYRGPTAGSYGPDEDALVRQSANRLAELLENILLRQRLDRPAEETRVLDRIGEVVSSGGPIGQVYRRFTHEIRKVLDVRVLSIYLAEPGSSRLTRVWRFGGGRRSIQHEPDGSRNVAEIGLPAPGSFGQNHIPEDHLVSPGEGWPEQQEGLRARLAMAVPVEYAGAVIGAVEVGCMRPGAYGPESNKLLRRAAALRAAPMANDSPSHRVIPGGVSLDLAKEIAGALASSRHLEDVLPSLAWALAKILSFDCLTLDWTDPNGWEIHTLRAYSGTEDTILTPDGQEAIHTQVLFQGQCIGMVNLCRKEGEAFTVREQEILDYLGIQMAPSVQNARLRELTQRQAYRLTTVRQMDGYLDPFRGLDNIVQEAVEEAARLADAGWAELYLYQEETLSFVQAAATAGDEGEWRKVAPHHIAGLVESCFHSGGSHVLPDVSGKPGPENGEIVLDNIGGCLGLPLKIVQETIGVLVVGGAWGQEWSQAGVILLEVFAGQVAEDIGMARFALDHVQRGSQTALESLRRELLTDVAGALRQPLNSIKGYAESLLLSDVSWPEEIRREFLETIGQQTDRLDRVVNDLLLPARWPPGAVILDSVVFSVKGLLDQVAVELERTPWDARSSSNATPLSRRCWWTLSAWCKSSFGCSRPPMNPWGPIKRSVWKEIGMRAGPCFQ